MEWRSLWELPTRLRSTANELAFLHFYRHDGDTWNEEQVSDTTPPYFAREIGHAVALSGGSAASASDNVNELYSYVRDSAGVWRESPDGVIAAEDGIAFIEGTVAIDGDWLVVGAHNAGYGPAAFLFTRGSSSEAWAAPAAGDSMLQASGLFADSVAIRGRTMVANGEPVRVFERGDDDLWQHSPLPVDSLGAVALTDNTLVVGAQQDEYNDPAGGEVNVYRRENGDASWIADPNSPLPASVGEVDAFGWSVATDGRTVVVGAPEEGLSGAVYVYD